MKSKRIFLIRCLILNILSILLLLSSKKFFWVWVRIELNLYFTIPILVFDSLARSFIYWLTNTLGGYMIFISVLLNQRQIFLWGGAFLKMRYFPLLFWLPFIISRLESLSLSVVLVLKKIPRFYVLYCCPLNLTWKFCISLRVFLFTRVILLFQREFKQLLAWSSKIQASLLMLVVKEKIKIFLVFFVLYSSMILVAVCCKSSIRVVLIITLLVMTGLPPLFRFLYKILFLAGIFSWMGGRFILFILCGGLVLRFMGYFRFIFSIVIKFYPNNFNRIIYIMRVFLLGVLVFLWAIKVV